jgi:hypothetical protein
LPLARGPITIATQAGLAYTVGARVRLASNSAPTQWMEGPVTAYSGTSLSLNIDLLSTDISPYPFPTLPNYLGGLTLANNATTPATVLNIATGCATSDDNTTSMPLVAANFTKNCNAAWAVGSGNGALDSGSALAANAWYHVFLITRTDTQVVDVLISTSLASPTLPTNYTKKRRIGSIATSASATIIPFSQFGDEFLWVTPIANLNNASWSANTTVAELTSVPPGLKVIGIYQIYCAPSGLVVYPTLYAPDASGNANNTVPPGNITVWVAAAAGGAVELRIRTNTSQQIMFSAVAAGNGLYLITRGWIDYRGK